MRRISAVLLVLVCAWSQLASAQGYRGRDFWICFPANALTEFGKRIQLSVDIASESRAKGMIETTMEDPRIPFSVEAGASTSIDLDSLLEIETSGVVERKAVHITSDQDISVYVVSHRPASTDSYMAIPTPLLGKNYVVAGYSPLFGGEPRGFTTQCTIVAAEDTTLVTAHLTAGTADGMPSGRTISLILHRGQTLQFQSIGLVAEKHDLTGTTVIANKPIAFVTGHRCAQIPPDESYCDMLMEMEPPVNDWGKDFILTKFERKDYYAVRVIANVDATDVTLDGVKVATLAADGYYENNSLHHDAVIHTSKPTLVAQYATSSSADSVKVGDPFMLFAIPNDRFITETTTTSVVAGNFRNYLNIVLPDTALNTLQIDEAHMGSMSPGEMDLGRKVGPLTLLHKRHLEGRTYTVLNYEVRQGRHLIQCAAPMAVYSYGFGEGVENFDSYGHACGERLDK